MELQQGGFRPTAEDVISKLKDEGDFDSLRLKIIRKLKDNEELQNRIISEVKQSVTLNRDGAENLKARQLSDSIHQEIGSKIMDQISNELWNIIRSKDDGMQNEIRETVQSVYDRLINPPQKEGNHAPSDQPPNVKEEIVSPKEASACDATLSCDSDPDLPPGFALPDQVQVINSGDEANNEQQHVQRPIEELREDSHGQADRSPVSFDDAPPGFSAYVETASQQGAASDEDPDVPPGFG